MPLFHCFLIVIWLIAQVTMMVVVIKAYSEFEGSLRQEALTKAVTTTASMSLGLLLLLYPVFSQNMSLYEPTNPNAEAERRGAATSGSGGVQ